MKKILLSCFLVVTSFSLYASDVTLTIFHSGDTHGRGMASEGIGYGKMSAYVKAFRHTSENVLFLDVGDAVSGVPVTDLSQGETNINAMNIMKYDGFTPGNADFMFGGQAILALQKKAAFPFISANIWYQDKLAFEPYIIKNIAGLNIGIIGVSPLNSMVATIENKLAGFRVTDPIDAVKDAISRIQDKTDLIIVLAHLGKTDPNVNIQNLVEAVPTIDVVIDGHDHIAVNDGRLLGHTIMVNTGQYGEYLGQLTLTIKDKKIVNWNEQLLNEAAFSSVTADKETEAYIQQVQEKSKATLSKIVMMLPFALDGERKHVRSGQTNLGSLLSDAEREYAKADIAFTVGAFLRDNINAGPVSYGAVLNALPFTLPLVTREMTGKQIIDFIEHNYNENPIITGAYAHVSGITFDVDFTQPVGNRMTNILVNGTPFDMNKTYLVACNEQVSDYGIREIEIKDRYDITMASLLTDYINKYPDLLPPKSRVHFIDAQK